MRRYKVINKTIYDSISNRRINQYFICLCDENKPDFFIPSAFSGFVIKYANAENSQKALAYSIVPFLNFIIEQVEEGIPLFMLLRNEGISGLNLHHLAHYINFISNDPDNPISRETVNTKEDDLIKLFYYLSDTGINKINEDILHKAREYNLVLEGTRRKRISPLDLCTDIYIHYPPKNNKKKSVLKDIREEIWDLMIEFAEEFYPIIAFAILLMICSGIRRGECVNLRVKDIKYDKMNDQIYINVQDNQNDLFKDRDIDLSNSQVKKPRKKQPVLRIYSRIEELFENHKNRLKAVYHTEHISDKPLFANADGNAMSGNSFSNYFTSFKASFLEFLRNEGFEEIADQLDYYKWGAHIGRHIFTNAIIKKGYANGGTSRPIPKLVALLRGDATEEASMVYIDEVAISCAIQENINEISKTATWYGGKINDKR